jgi:tight adherence protein C
MMGSIYLVVSLVAVGIALATLVLAFASGAGQATGVARSLALIEQRVDVQEVGRGDLPILDRLVFPFFARLRGLAFRLSPTGASMSMARRLDLAGNPGSWTAERIMGAKGAGLLGLGMLGLLFGGFGIKGLLFAAAGGAAGFWLPDLLLYNQGVKRQQELRRGLADALDMLTVCVEAGQGFDSALQQVAKSVDGPIAGEFARVLSEIQIGKARSEAFTSLGARTSVHEAKTFVSAFVQADRLGLPIGAVLREQANQMRLVRRQLAEEKAQKVPVKILFPMLLCIFPALFIVIIGPGAISMMDAFSGL